MDVLPTSAPAGGTPIAVLAFCVLTASVNGHFEQQASIRASFRARWRAVADRRDTRWGHEFLATCSADLWGTLHPGFARIRQGGAQQQPSGGVWLW
jgi:hypothetical protein